MEEEEKARKQGWVPQEEFKGDPEIWRSAEEFNKRGEEILPIVKERLEKTLSQNDQILKDNQDIKLELQKTKETMSELNDFYKGTEERAFKKALNELKKEQKTAAAAGDADKVLEISAEIEGVRDAMVKEPAKTPDKSTVSPDFKPWQDNNKWYGTDPELTTYADSVLSYVGRVKYPSDVEFYEAVTEEVKKRFPDSFENANKKKPSAVDGGGGKSVNGTTKKSYDNLPDDAKKACDKFVRDIPGFTKKQYIDTYIWEV